MAKIRGYMYRMNLTLTVTATRLAVNGGYVHANQGIREPVPQLAILHFDQM
jgi:hypothetical protein